QSRQREANSSDLAEITLMDPGDILFLYSDGVFDGSDDQQRQYLEAVLREHSWRPAKEICNRLLQLATEQDVRLSQAGEDDRIDDKTVFIIKRH
ncbi:MAG: SpoIIE family protein phosphatase, partial [Acidobacteria bacterium]|nr:SpoIIE family protein phosphatase [Acidobacteriota bacterium]